MLKKIFCAAIMAITIFIGAKVSAEDVFVYSYSNGTYCYVMTETFVNRTQYRDNRAFSVDVKFTRYNQTLAVNNYSFRENDGIIWYGVDGGADDFIGNDALAKKIWAFGLKHLGIDYEVRND